MRTHAVDKRGATGGGVEREERVVRGEGGEASSQTGCVFRLGN